MGNQRDTTGIDFGVGDRELKVERCIEAAPEDVTTRAGAVEWAMEMALDHRGCLRDAREDIRERAQQASGEYHHVTVRTGVERDGRRA